MEKSAPISLQQMNAMQICTVWT